MQGNVKRRSEMEENKVKLHMQCLREEINPVRPPLISTSDFAETVGWPSTQMLHSTVSGSHSFRPAIVKGIIFATSDINNITFS